MDNLTTLAERLARHKEEETRQIEKIEKDALKSLADGLKSFTAGELSTIEAAIKERRRAIENEAKAMSEAIERSLVKTRKETIAQSKALRQELISEIDQVKALAIDGGAKIWLWRLITPVVLIGALAAGTWGLGAYLTARITGQIKQLEELKAEAKQQRATMNRFVIRSYTDALEFDQKPRLWQTKEGTWVVQFKTEGR